MTTEVLVGSGKIGALPLTRGDEHRVGVGEQRAQLINKPLIAHAFESFYISLSAMTDHIYWPDMDNSESLTHNPAGNPVFRSYIEGTADEKVKVGVRQKTIEVRDKWIPLRKETVKVFKGVARRTEPEMSEESFLSLFFVRSREGLLVPVMGEISGYDDDGFLVVPELMSRKDWQQFVMRAKKVRAAFPEEAPVEDNINEDTWREKCTLLVPSRKPVSLGDRHYSVLLMGKPRGKA